MKNLTLLACTLLLTISVLESAEIGFSGDVTVVSTYVFRGLKQFSGAALQGTGEFSYGPVTAGMWVSSFNGSVPVETDPYLSVALPTGEIETSIGVQLFSYDLFSRREYSVYELTATAGYGPFSGAFFFTPKQDYQESGETVELVPDALYWVELGAGTAFMGADLSATLGYGTFSSFLSAGETDKATTTLLLSAGKSLSEKLSASWNWSIALDEYTDNVFFLQAGYRF